MTETNNTSQADLINFVEWSIDNIVATEREIPIPDVDFFTTEGREYRDVVRDHQRIGLETLATELPERGGTWDDQLAATKLYLEWFAAETTADLVSCTESLGVDLSDDELEGLEQQTLDGLTPEHHAGVIEILDQITRLRLIRNDLRDLDIRDRLIKMINKFAPLDEEAEGVDPDAWGCEDPECPFCNRSEQDEAAADEAQAE